MDRWLLIIATVLTLCGSIRGMLAVHRGRRSRSTVIWMGAAMICQLLFLAHRGAERAMCPLRDLGEILVFLAWSLTLFYMVIGSAYRISLLGVFTAPVVAAFQAVALLPGVLEPAPQASIPGNWFHELHSATSVLAYGALALAAIAGMMFLVLDRQLKEHHLSSGLFRNLPPVRELLVSLKRLLWLGWGVLSIGILAGILMPHPGSGSALAPTTAVTGHLIAAITVWLAYGTILAIHTRRGLTGRKLALLTVACFVLSLGVFAFI